MKKISTIVILFLLLSPAYGVELSEFIKDELQVIQKNLEDSRRNPIDSDYGISKVRIRVRGKGALEVPFLAKFELKPIVEFHFQKK